MAPLCASLPLGPAASEEVREPPRELCFQSQGMGLPELSLLGKPPFLQLLLGTAAVMGIKGTRRGRDL